MLPHMEHGAGVLLQVEYGTPQPSCQELRAKLPSLKAYSYNWSKKEKNPDDPFKVVCGVALLLALLLIGAATASHATNTVNATYLPPKGPPHTPNTARVPISQMYNAGQPAILVHRIIGVTQNNPSTPAFTRDDVIAYLNTNGFPAGPLVQGAHLKILTFQFITAKQASDRMKGEFVGLPDNSLVCYVKVQGPFMLTNVHLPKGYPRTTAEIGDIVFDGHTGNLMIWGFY